MSSCENGCAANSKDSTEPHQFGLDDILVKIGHVGKFQYRFFLIVIALAIFHAIIKYGFIFTASALVYRCRVQECDKSENLYEQPWTEFTIPKSASGELEKCQRFKTLFNSTNQQNICYKENYDRELKSDCDNDFIFRDKEVTVSNEFKVFCSDEWKLAMVGSLNNLGQGLGIPLGGFFADRYGRCNIISFGAILSAILGTARSFSPNFYTFVILGFLDNLFGGTIYATAYILGLEFLGPSVRIHASLVAPIFNSIGRFLLALISKYLKNWRLIERFFYFPTLAFIALPWILPESVRWLLSQGEEEKAVKLLHKAARINKRKLSDSSIEKLLQGNRQILADVETKNNKFHICDAFKIFPWRIINCSLCWFGTVFVFMGLTVNSTLLGNSKYNSFMYVSLIEIPGTILPSLTLNRFGRKLSLFGYYFLTGIFIMAMNFVSSGNLRLILYLLGKMTISATFQALYILTSEIFPTNARNSLLSFCSMIGRLGSMCSPQTLLLAKYYASAPSVLFASCAFLSSLLVILLPETKDLVLPTTLHDAEKIGQKKIKVPSETEIEEKLLMSKM